ncbi:thermonuclease family protein [Kosmotoga sp. DU53]|uniref:thermonuclease family protein n=1 Tax=Kosmotoga sp. DU53 TaxID=1310160 RepID=UPI0007C4E5F0|nr:thermonuclease family protein [Kosmotoga sp. DU53]MDK2954034.1 micrococcal nuclease [Kosmotoga sp.]OAA21208.1 hypothetical protein DU53_06280 [Kosmotoga sp. DU53]
MRTKWLLVMYLLLINIAFTITPITLSTGSIQFIYAEEWLKQLQPTEYASAEVYSNIDGDTIKVILDSEIETIRMIGVDTPESVHPRKPVEYFGKSASLFSKLLR